MSDNPWIRNGADFKYYDRFFPDDIVTIKNSGDFVEDFYLYSSNFNLAADQVMLYLLSLAERNHAIGELDTWFFAIAYLYRHSLELIIKSIALKIIVPSERENYLKTVRHDLIQAFEIVEDGVGAALATSISNREALNWLSDYLTDISLLDKESDMFRYPFNHRMMVFFDEQTSIDLLSMRESYGTAYSLLSEIYSTEQITLESYKHNLPKFLIYGGAYNSQAVIGYKFSHYDYYPFIKGYGEIANCLLKNLITKDNKDSLFLPMCYLYRNAVELGLKRIICEDCNLSSNQALQIINKEKHNIYQLWKAIKEEVEKHANTPAGDTTIADVTEYINQLHNLDPDSTKFRYPITMNMGLHFRSVTKYSVNNMSACFEELISFLDAVDFMLGEIRSFEADMRRDFENYQSDY